MATDEVKVSQLFIQCKKNNSHIFADFGASLQTSCTPEGHFQHVLTKLDECGLAASSNLKDGDVIIAMKDESCRVQDVPHSLLVERFQKEVGRKFKLLIKRGHGETVEERLIGAKIGLTWRGMIPVAKKQTDELLRESRIRLNTKYTLHSTTDVYITQRQNSIEKYLGLYQEDGDGSGEAQAKFLTSPFVLRKHIYNATKSYSLGANGRIEQMVAFSAFLGRGSDDDNDDCAREYRGDEYRREKCIAGNSEGPLSVMDFPPKMKSTHSEISLNCGMFVAEGNQNGTYKILAADTSEDLYVGVGEDDDEAHLLCSQHELNEHQVHEERRLYPSL